MRARASASSAEALFEDTGRVSADACSFVAIQARREKSREAIIILVKLRELLASLIHHKPLPTRYLDHPCEEIWRGYREAHIEPDWLLIYRVVGNELRLVRTLSHSDLFSRNEAPLRAMTLYASWWDASFCGPFAGTRRGETECRVRIKKALISSASSRTSFQTMN